MEPGQPETPHNFDSDNRPQVFFHRTRRRRLVSVLLIFVLATVFFGALFWWLSAKSTVEAPASQTKPLETKGSNVDPEMATKVLIEGRDRIWDTVFLPNGELLFSERSGKLSVYKNDQANLVATISDVVALGEGGLMGIEADPDFLKNRYVYTCYNTSQDIRVVRWYLRTDFNGLEDRKDIVTGAPRNPTGRHSGCRIRFGIDGYLWIGTGDTAQTLTPQSPQDPKSLGGKILRVDRDGRAAPGNLGGKFDSRIYSYGHRNTQGLAFFDQPVAGVPGISVEHGTSVDDEVNKLMPGNFGWAPPDGPYDESVAMTDKSRFPDAIDAIWSSGNPTQAPSGATILKGDQWKGWNGAVAVAMLKTQHLKILKLDDKLRVSKEIKKFEGEFGRLRSARLGPDGKLYLSTDNGDNDKIIVITPR